MDVACMWLWLLLAWLFQITCCSKLPPLPYLLSPWIGNSAVVNMAWQLNHSKSWRPPCSELPQCSNHPIPPLLLISSMTVILCDNVYLPDLMLKYRYQTKMWNFVQNIGRMSCPLCWGTYVDLTPCRKQSVRCIYVRISWGWPQLISKTSASFVHDSMQWL
jgi:hypothetical protein